MIAPAPVRADAPARPLAWGPVTAVCLAVALASLAVPATLGFDPWAWLVWGREIGRWTIDTTGGPSWKPLPVAVTTLLAPLGALAVPAYLVVARTVALLGVVVVARLAGRLGGPVAAVVAGALIWLTPDGEPRFLRVVLEGHEAPWSAALAVAALTALVDRRVDRALLWLWLLSLLRPEAWPFLLGLVAWTWAPPARLPSRWWGVAALASIPLLWFVPDWIGSGSPFHGAGTAQVLADRSAGSRLGDSLRTLADVVPAPVWALAGVAVVVAWRRARRVPAALAGAALAWSTVVVAMAAVAGYAAISRFFLPAAAVLVVLAGVGAAEVVRLVRSAADRRVLTAALVLAVLGVGLIVPRVRGLADVADEVVQRGRLADDLDRTIDRAGGADALRQCGAAVVTARTLLRSAAAWELDLALSDVEMGLRDAERSVADRPAVLLLASARATEAARAAPHAVELAEGRRWVAFVTQCDPASP